MTEPKTAKRIGRPPTPPETHAKHTQTGICIRKADHPAFKDLMASTGLPMHTVFHHLMSYVDPEAFAAYVAGQQPQP